MRIDEFSRECGGLQWREERIRSLDGTEIALCVSDMPASATGAKKPVYILYFQGNGSSIPPRLPHLSWILRRARDNDPSVTYTMKWLPYQYLWPFLRNHLDSWTNLGIIAKRFKERSPGVYIVEAGKDELVPGDHGEKLQQRCEHVGLPVERHKVRGALHNEAMVRASGKQALADSISTAAARAQHGD
ncbi:hypothetical protein N0V84_010460 [Fusarium piperis]|uniref:Uncharacterized protein n=1 Tax=Fusarium piperis TaxID=1435070 RepID=A0A9W8TD10_9HYPO|nr:hypothetical protein N0V84_010460 [Fusarium piperis]